jgi:hypothetical protein
MAVPTMGEKPRFTVHQSASLERSIKSVSESRTMSSGDVRFEASYLPTAWKGAQVDWDVIGDCTWIGSTALVGWLA